MDGIVLGSLISTAVAIAVAHFLSRNEANESAKALKFKLVSYVYANVALSGMAIYFAAHAAFKPFVLLGLLVALVFGQLLRVRAELREARSSTRPE